MSRERFECSGGEVVRFKRLIVFVYEETRQKFTQLLVKQTEQFAKLFLFEELSNSVVFSEKVKVVARKGTGQTSSRQTVQLDFYEYGEEKDIDDFFAKLGIQPEILNRKTYVHDYVLENVETGDNDTIRAQANPTSIDSTF